MKEFQDSLKSAYNVSLRRLGYSAMTKKQTEMYLLKKGYTQNIVHQALDKLIADGYIDDASFAANVVRNALERKPKSRMMLSHELRLKGISDEVLSNVMELFDDEQQQQMADRLAYKYLMRHILDDNESSKHKISRALYRKGFEWSVINKALKDVNSDD